MEPSGRLHVVVLSKIFQKLGSLLLILIVPSLWTGLAPVTMRLLTRLGMSSLVIPMTWRPTMMAYFRVIDCTPARGDTPARCRSRRDRTSVLPAASTPVAHI